MYVRLNTAIDSTANRATVEYVDNAINVSLGKITNALNTNNLNVDNIIEKIKNQSSDFVEGQRFLIYRDESNTVRLWVNNNITDCSDLCSGLEETGYRLCPLFPSNGTNFYNCYRNYWPYESNGVVNTYFQYYSTISTIPKTATNLNNCLGDYSSGSTRGFVPSFYFYGYDNVTDVDNFYLSNY